MHYKFQNAVEKHIHACYVVRFMGGAAVWAEWAIAHPKFWLGGPQCIWPDQ